MHFSYEKGLKFRVNLKKVPQRLDLKPFHSILSIFKNLGGLEW